MRFSLMTEPQMGGTYERLLDLARWAEDAGMTSFARSDHYYSPREPRRPVTDAFATLAGLARDVHTIRLCVLVTPVTFRHPAVIAKTAATIDQMSDGRLDLGVGTGWMELEHHAFGIPFPDSSERFARLEEALPYLRAAFTGARFEGDRYRLTADVLPRPSGVRIVVGGSGGVRTPTLAGVHADEYNHFICTAEEIRPKVDIMRRAAHGAGRDAEAIEVTVMGPVLAGVDETSYRRNLARRAAERDISASELEQRWSNHGIPVGPPERLAESLDELAQAGVSRFYLQWMDIEDTDELEETWAALRLGLG